MRMLAGLIVILSPPALADCQDVVKRCDDLVRKQGDLIQILQERNDDLDARLADLSDAFESSRNNQGLYLMGGVVGGVILMTILSSR